MSSFSNKIQDGLDDLISGVTGIRRSKVGKMKTAADKFRTSGVGPGRPFEIAQGPEARRKLGEVSSHIEWPEGMAGDAYFVIDAAKAPSLNKVLQHPRTVKLEDGSELEFPNYIHFRSLKRRSGKRAEQSYDIFLYVPDTLNDNLAVTYSEAELGIIDSLISNFVKTDQVQAGWGVDENELAVLAKTMSPGGKMMQAAAGRGVNPLKYQLFEGVAFRTFTYSFTLRPKNKNEAREINQIISAFKREALPGVEGSNSRIYTFPTEWSIQFVGPIKNWVDFPLVSVCTGVNVDYAGGQPLALHDDGSPSVVALTVNFTETTQLNRQKYDEWVSNLDRDLHDVEGGTSINNAMARQARAQMDEEQRRIEEANRKKGSPKFTTGDTGIKEIDDARSDRMSRNLHFKFVAMANSGNISDPQTAQFLREYFLKNRYGPGKMQLDPALGGMGKYITGEAPDINGQRYPYDKD